MIAKQRSNNGAEALINVIAMLHPYNIWKLPSEIHCGHSPRYCTVNIFFCCILVCPIDALEACGYSEISLSTADSILTCLSVFIKIRSQAIHLVLITRSRFPSTATPSNKTYQRILFNMSRTVWKFALAGKTWTFLEKIQSLPSFLRWVLVT